MATIIALSVYIGLIVFVGTFAGTVLWFFAETVDKFFLFNPVMERSWWDCVRFGWVCTILFKGAGCLKK
jgi:hypothetical protein